MSLVSSTTVRTMTTISPSSPELSPGVSKVITHTGKAIAFSQASMKSGQGHGEEVQRHSKASLVTPTGVLQAPAFPPFFLFFSFFQWVLFHPMGLSFYPLSIWWLHSQISARRTTRAAMGGLFRWYLFISRRGICQRVAFYGCLPPSRMGR